MNTTEQIIDILIIKISAMPEVRANGISWEEKPFSNTCEGDIDIFIYCDAIPDADKRQDVLFYHFALDIAIDHYLQALFAINKTFFPSRKRSLQYIERFLVKPHGCAGDLPEVIRLGGCADTLEASYALWRKMTEVLKKIV